MSSRGVEILIDRREVDGKADQLCRSAAVVHGVSKGGEMSKKWWQGHMNIALLHLL